LIGDEVRREALCLKKGSKRVDVSLLITGSISLSVRWAGSNAPGVVVGHVGYKSSNSSRGSGGLVKFPEELCSGGKVGGPAQPASMSSIKIHDNVLQIQSLDGILSQRLVGVGRVRTLLYIGVGHKVSQAVWLDDKNKRDVRECLDLSSDVVDIAPVKSSSIVSEREFAIGSQSRAVSLREIVDDKREDQVCTGSVLCLNIFRESGDGRDFGANITGRISTW
jgi:hypothetical protein